MPVCTRCNIDKPDDAYRHKGNNTSRPGYRFPVCIQCEQEQHIARMAAELRSAGYVAEAIDPAVKQRNDDDSARDRGR